MAMTAQERRCLGQETVSDYDSLIFVLSFSCNSLINEPAHALLEGVQEWWWELERESSSSAACESLKLF